jgi:hypothetical protein
MTEDGKELTRVCVIDFASGTVVYDQLVKPAKPIVDYLTKCVSISTGQILRDNAHTSKVVWNYSGGPQQCDHDF